MSDILRRRTARLASFQPYEPEWWHYDFKEWRQYPVLNLSFSELTAADAKPAAGARD